MHIPESGNDEVLDHLSLRELRYVARELAKHETSGGENVNGEVRQINALFSVNPLTNEVEEDPQIEKFREKIHEDFDGVLLGTEVIPDPPERGPYGEAYIPRIDNYAPTRSKPFRMHGEKYEAHVKVTEEWLEKKLEKPKEGQFIEWLSQTFVVPKKSAEFPVREGVDMRGPNSQSRRVNYPLPKIEDILVKHGANQIFSILDLSKRFTNNPYTRKVGQ